MDLFDFLNSEYKAFKEEGLDEIPNGDINNPDDTGKDTPADDEYQSQSDNSSYDYSNDNNEYDDNYSDEEPNENDPFADVEDSEFSLITDLRKNYADLYNNQYISYTKLKSENFESSEFEKEFKVLLDMYRRTLNLLYIYISRKYKDESTTSKITTFVEFKEKFVTMVNECNRLISIMDKKSKKDMNVIF